MKKTAVFLILIFIFVPSVSAAGQKYSSAYEKRAQAFLNKSKSAFSKENFVESKTYLLKLLATYPASGAKEEALVVLANIHMMNNHMDSAQSVIVKFVKDLASSPYLPRMEYYQGLIYLHQRHNYDAAQMFINTINTSESQELFNKAKKQLQKLISRGNFNEEELQRIIQNLKYDGELLSGALLELGDLQMTQRRFKAAQITYNMWIHYFAGEKKEAGVKDKLRQAKKGTILYKTVLIMVPLSGFDAEIGKSLLEGMLVALDESSSAGGSIIKHKVIDTKGDPILAVNRLRRALQDDEVIAVLGPVMSDVSTAVAVELSSGIKKTAMITPTATTKGISALGRGIFQINVTTHALAETISRYSVQCLSLKEFAILAPNTEYGIDLAASFETDVTKRGGSIIAVEYYDPEAKDHSGHIQVIRRRIAQAEVEKKWPIYKSRDKYTFDKKVASFAADSVLHLDGVFIAAANGDELLKLSSQVSYNKLKTRFLGSSGWYDNSIFHKGVQSALGAVFSVGYYQDQDSDTWKTFNKEYMSRWNQKPTIISALGYNAAAFLLKGLEEDRENNLIKSLSRIDSLNGVLGKIKMERTEGYNKSALLLEVGTRKFERIETCKEPDAESKTPLFTH